MRMRVLSFVFLLFLVSCIESTRFYGVADYSSNNNKTTTTAVVEIDPQSGQFTTLFENVVFVGYVSQIFGGDTAFDQKAQILYYTDNGNADFVFAVDVVEKKIVKTYSTGAEQIIGVEYDSINDNLIISGFYGYGVGLVVLPISGEGSVLFYNLTDIFGELDFYAGGAFDSENQIYYNIYGTSDGDNMVQKLAVVDIKTNETRSGTIDCGNDYMIFGLTADPAHNRLISIAPSSSNIFENSFLVIDPTTYTCNATFMGKFVTGGYSSAYDPSTEMAYILYTGDQDVNYLGYYDIAKNDLSAPIQLESSLVAYAVSF